MKDKLSVYLFKMEEADNCFPLTKAALNFLCIQNKSLIQLLFFLSTFNQTTSDYTLRKLIYSFSYFKGKKRRKLVS